MQQKKHSSISQSALWKLLVYSMLLMGIIIGASDFIGQLYFSGQLTSIGLVLNGLIIALFLIAIVHLLLLLWRYRTEELMLAKFSLHIEDNASDILHGIDTNSLIARRYHTIQHILNKHVPVNHHALASTLLAKESTRTGGIRFIHNILILCGVFGTIVSLSIALFGASDLLESAVSSSGMGLVIHGMSTALSTTMTAIICYLFLSYFFGLLQDVQTYVLSDIEQLTTTHLLPDMQATPDSINQRMYALVQTMAKLLQSMGVLTQQMQENQQTLPHMLEILQHRANHADMQHAATMEILEAMQNSLREGFRLKDQ